MKRYITLLGLGLSVFSFGSIAKGLLLRRCADMTILEGLSAEQRLGRLLSNAEMTQLSFAHRVRLIELFRAINGNPYATPHIVRLLRSLIHLPLSADQADRLVALIEICASTSTRLVSDVEADWYAGLNLLFDEVPALRSEFERLGGTVPAKEEDLVAVN